MFTASATAFAEGRNGKIFRSATASSSISQADARQKAGALARASANNAASGMASGAQASGGAARERYPYGVRTLVEPVLRRVALGGGAEIARITENSYHASVLNAYNVMFVDVDTEDNTGRNPATGERPAAAQSVSQDVALNALVELVAARPELSFRVYATRAGLRYLCTSRLFDPASAESEHILKTLKSDPRYTLLCNKQKCYRARLSPKSWRCFAKVAIKPGASDAREDKPRGFFARLFGAASNSRTRTLTEPADFAVCHFVQTVGSEKIGAPEIAEIVRLHDEACGVGSGKPLA